MFFFSQCNQLQNCVLEFIGNFSKSYCTKSINVIETVAILCPNILQPLIPKLSEIVMKAEHYKGAGVDKQLRYGHKLLHTLLCM